MALTNKQRAFIIHYLGDCQWNATQAARRAGYKHPRQQGSRLLSNVVVKQEIDATLAAMGAAAEALRARWLDRLGVDISPYVTDAGLDLKGLKAAGLGYLVKGYRKTKDAVTIILRDPDVAEERLARHLGMFVERKVVTGKDGGPVEHRDVTTRDLSQYTDEELAQLAAIARRTRGD